MISPRIRNFPVPSFTVIALLVAAGYAAALFVPLMDNDSAHHASIALNMLHEGGWASLVEHEGMPYLDKPHLQFWLVAASFSLFGVGGVAYKISSLLFTLAGVWAVYRLGVHLRDERTGRTAALLLATTAAFALANVDVRMDAILTASIALAVWQGVLHIDSGGRIGHLLLTAAALAAAFATKGWIGVMVPFFALGSYLVGRRKLGWFASWRFPALVAAFFLFISPVLLAYWLQFDLHPELVIRGSSGHSGIRFILWDQIFARMGGAHGTASSGDPFFFLHTSLWALLPWSALFYALLARDLGRLFKREAAFDAVRWLTLPATVLTVAALSLSSFKLPHYLNVVFPLTSLYMACALYDLRPGRLVAALGTLQRAIAAGMVAGVGALCFVCFPVDGARSALLAFALVYTLAAAWAARDASAETLLRTGALTSAVVWLALNTAFYPQLLKYQGGNTLARTLRAERIPLDDVGLYDNRDIGYSLDIYAGRVFREWPADEIAARLAAGRDVWLVTPPAGLDSLRAEGFAAEIVDRRPDYRITRLNLRFLNPSTRPSCLTELVLARIRAGQSDPMP